MKAYIFFSVHEELFHRVALELVGRGVTEFCGFAWGKQQEQAVVGRGIEYDPMVVFTRDLLPKADDGTPPDLGWLAQRERELGISIQRMLNAERHLLAGRSFEQIMRLAEVALRVLADALDRARPDFIFSEDVSCFHSYVHRVLARERGIPFWAIGSGRMPKRIGVYKEGPEHWERYESAFARIREHGLNGEERREAEAYLTAFRERPVRPTGMGTRAKKPGIDLADRGRLMFATKHYFGDRDNPTAIPPHRVVQQRLVRIARIAAADVMRVFERPVDGEKYVLYPIHFQPEASTLVQAPMYVDQVALIHDIAASLPAGYRLYVKEHVSNRGRRPLEFYEAIRAIPSVRLLGPDEDTWTLIRSASVVAVITGTVGWEGLMFDKPVVTFGTVFFNLHPTVLRASQVPKDGWYELFQRAATQHVPDREATLQMIAALREGSHPGFIGNPHTFPEALESENVKMLADALVREQGIAS